MDKRDIQYVTRQEFDQFRAKLSTDLEKVQRVVIEALEEVRSSTLEISPEILATLGKEFDLSACEPKSRSEFVQTIIDTPIAVKNVTVSGIKSAGKGVASFISKLPEKGRRLRHSIHEHAHTT